MDADVRWLQRLASLDRALESLKEACGREDLNLLEQQGAIQRFEFVFELAWKTLKDLLEFDGAKFESITARSVIKEAFAARIIVNGQTWIDMLEHRNQLSHTYNQEVFEKAFQLIRSCYLPEISTLHAYFHRRAAQP